jgi:murein tripeptide amidase MpaA
MRRWGIWACAAVLALVLSASAGAADRSKLNVYTAKVSAAKAGELVRGGYDVVETRVAADGVRIDLVLSASERDRVAAQGVNLALKRDKKGRTIAQRAAIQAANGFTVWRSFDEPGGLRDEMYAIAKKNAGFVKLVVLGRTHQGREIIALKLTQAAKGTRDGARPAALYASTQHAREWISTEVNRRFMLWLIQQRKAENPEIVNLLKTTELWFVWVANPDGYEYTHDVERLWRKNLRDNNGDGQITNGDGVDPNRNYPSHWKYDNEGSSSQTSSETYRGPAAGSEPETQAIMGLAGRVNFKFIVNWHSVGSWILYAPGWQMETVAADTPIYVALAGTDARPAIPDFDPGPSANELYVTNGETTDWFAEVEGALGFTPELSDAGSGGGFVFPDNEALVQREADNTRPFALDIAKSIRNPANPASHLGNTTAPFYLNLTSIDPEMSRAEKGNFAFQWSYGDPQPVRILAKRSLGAVSLKYQINGGAVQTRPTSEWAGGEVYGQEGSLYYHVVEGAVTGTSPGDSVRVWFEGGGATSGSFTYQAVSETGNDVLVMAAEDYSGASSNPAYPAGPRPFFLSSYANALSANGIAFDLYDVDARNRTAPDALGVLTHYKAVIWYTGNDLVTREPGWGPGNASRLANDEIIEVRAFLNEGGRLLHTGKFAGHQGTTAHGTQLYDPIANEQCRANPAVEARCEPLHGVGDLTNDFLQYWLGTYILNDNAGNGNPACNPATFANCNVVDVEGVNTPFTSLIWGFNGADSAGNQNHSASFLTTSGILGPEFPHFDSWVAGKYMREGGPFEPHDGTKYMYSQMADVSYKRLTRTIAVPTAGATLSFWASYDTEHLWDYLIVEARTAGQNDWTTLRDLNGHTTQGTGDSCPAGWRELHPHLDHYQTLNADGTCSPNGTTGEWWGAEGNSGGWQEWRVDLSAYAGKQVEVSLAYVSDWAVQGLGVFLDHITVSTGEGTTSFEDDADPMDGWAVTGPPPGSAPNANNFIRTDAQGFPEGAVVATDDTIYMGFGFEGITGAATRAAVMDRAMDYLLR